MRSWSVTTIGVADLEEALSLWQGDLDFEIAAQHDRADPGLARLWNISPAEIARQALVRTPGIDVGMLHLVEFVDPGPPVREGAQAYDLCPKNLDIYTEDMPARMAELRERGRRFTNKEFSEVVAPSGITFREIHMPSHDSVNVVLLELLGEAIPLSPAGYSGVGMLIVIVPNAAVEQAFYRDILGLELLSENVLAGPEVEKMVGLPSGAALDISIWGDSTSDFGRIEIIEYRGVRGNNLYPRARPKALGILRVSYAADDLAALRGKLESAAIDCEDIDNASTIYSNGPMLSISSPAGLRIDVYQR